MANNKTYIKEERAKWNWTDIARAEKDAHTLIWCNTRRTPVSSRFIERCQCTWSNVRTRKQEKWHHWILYSVKIMYLLQCYKLAGSKSWTHASWGVEVSYKVASKGSMRMAIVQREVLITSVLISVASVASSFTRDFCVLLTPEPVPTTTSVALTSRCPCRLDQSF